MKTILVLTVVALATVSGCSSTAGPFVTNISSDGDNGLIIEKCMLVYSRGSATVGNKDCHSTQIYLRPGKKVAND